MKTHGCACPEQAAGKHVGACLAVAPGSAVVGFLDGGGWSACFGLSYRDLCIHDAFRGQRMARSGAGELRALTGSGGIPANRNKVVRGFLDKTVVSGCCSSIPTWVSRPTRSTG
jgi:hypothetical protein